MSGRVLGPRMQRHLEILPREVGVEVEGIAVQNCRLADDVTELEVHFLEILESASFEVKLLFKGLGGEALRRVVGVQNRLLELLSERALVEAGEIESVEICCAPELALLHLLVEDGFV